MLFTREVIKTEDINTVSSYLNEYDADVQTVTPEEAEQKTEISMYISSLASMQYKKSIDDINNTKTDNIIKRKRNLQQVMRESFFYGANRFGNNFIA